MRCRYHCASPDFYPSHTFIYIFSAYELYADLKSGERQASEVGPEETKEKKTTMAERFKKAFSRENVTVHFVGVWCIIYLVTAE